MSLTFLLGACAFAALVGVLVACVDWWRESRLSVARPVQRVGIPVARIASAPARRKRAA